MYGGPAPAYAPERARDAAADRDQWSASEQLTGVPFPVARPAEGAGP